MIEINNLTSDVVSKKFLEKVAKIVLKGERATEKVDLSIALVSQNRIKELNRKYRKKNRATDVLSFINPAEWDEKFKVAPLRKNEELGEIAICLKEVKNNAKKFGFTFEKEIARVLIHGILHLFGYDHEKNKADAKKMQEKEIMHLAQVVEEKFFFSTITQHR